MYNNSIIITYYTTDFSCCIAIFYSITYVKSVRYVAVIIHESRGRGVVYYGNVPNGRDISNFCRHNCGFYGNRRKNPSFPGSNRFSFCVSRGLSPLRALCRRLTCCLLPPKTAIFPLPPLTLPLLPLSVARSPRYCGNLFSLSPLAYCLFQPPLIRHPLLPRFIERFLAPLLLFTLTTAVLERAFSLFGI